MFVHHVFFWLKNPDSKADADSLWQGLQTLQQIEPKISMNIGRAAATNREVIDSSYDFSELLLFATAEDEAAYQVHAIHQQFISNYGHLWKKVVVYDSVDI